MEMEDLRRKNEESLSRAKESARMELSDAIARARTEKEERLHAAEESGLLRARRAR